MKLALMLLLAAFVSFALGYFWPRTQYTFNPETMMLCAENGWDGKACATVRAGGWVPVLNNYEAKP